MEKRVRNDIETLDHRKGKKLKDGYPETSSPNAQMEQKENSDCSSLNNETHEICLDSLQKNGREDQASLVLKGLYQFDTDELPIALPNSHEAECNGHNHGNENKKYDIGKVNTSKTSRLRYGDNNESETTAISKHNEDSPTSSMDISDGQNNKTTPRFDDVDGSGDLQEKCKEDNITSPPSCPSPPPAAQPSPPPPPTTDSCLAQFAFPGDGEQVKDFDGDIKLEEINDITSLASAYSLLQSIDDEIAQWTKILNQKMELEKETQKQYEKLKRDLIISETNRKIIDELQEESIRKNRTAAWVEREMQNIGSETDQPNPKINHIENN